jgi:chorismate mutase/prephenate dehydratase
MTDRKRDFERMVADLERADADLVKALDARAKAIRAVIDLRQADAEGYYVLPRDAEVLARATELAAEFPKKALEPVLREVLSACAGLSMPVKVVYLGPEGGFAQVAARRKFGASAELRIADTVAEVLDDVTRKRAAFGVVPLETSSDGALTATLNGLTRADVKICGEVTLPGSYHIVSVTGNAPDIEKIYGMRAALSACERHLTTHFPRATVIDVSSGRDAAHLAASDHGAAALVTDAIAEEAELRFVRKQVEDASGVEIRFAVVGSELPARTGQDRTVLAVAVRDGPGALYRALRPFADRNINLTRLESRPAHGEPFRYLFFVELDGHVTDRPVLTAIEELRAETQFLKVLGSYPRPA